MGLVYQAVQMLLSQEKERNFLEWHDSGHLIFLDYFVLCEL